MNRTKNFANFTVLLLWSKKEIDRLIFYCLYMQHITMIKPCIYVRDDLSSKCIMFVPYYVHCTIGLCAIANH